MAPRSARSRTHTLLRVLEAIAVTVIAVVALLYCFLNPIMAKVTQWRLDKLHGVVGTFSDVRCTLWPPGYDVYHLKITEKPATKHKTPLFYADRIEMRWSWRELVKGRLVRRIKAWDAKLVYRIQPDDSSTGKAALARQAAAKAPPPESMAKTLLAMDPFRLERLEAVDSQILVVDDRDKGHPRIWLHDVQAVLENLASRPNLTYGKPTLLTARAILQHTGRLDAFVTADPLDQGLTFAGEARLRGFQLADLYELVSEKTGLKIPRGKLDVFASFRCKNGEITGAVKPVISDAKVEAAQPGLGAKIKAALVDVSLEIFSDRVPGRNAVATIIPIQGSIRGPKVQLWPTVLAVVRNAFVEGLSASLEGLPPPEANKPEGPLPQAKRALTKGKHPPVKVQPEEHAQPQGGH